MLGAHSRALISVVDKVCVSGRQWNCVRTDIEISAECLQSYTDYLGEAGEKQERKSLPHPVRQISEYLTVTCFRPAPVGDLSPDEEKINDRLTLEESMPLCSLMKRPSWAGDLLRIGATSCCEIFTFPDGWTFCVLILVKKAPVLSSWDGF